MRDDGIQESGERHGDAELSAEDSLALIQRQQTTMGERLDVNPVMIYGAWGVAWLIGFGAFYLTVRDDSTDSLVVPALVGGFLLLSAVVLTMVHTMMAFRGIRGANARTGALYGWTWFLAFACLIAMFNAFLRYGLPMELRHLFMPAGSVLLVGVMYLMGGALWREYFQAGLGAWLLVVNSVAVFTGIPGAYLIYALAGGGGMVLAAAYFAVRRLRHRRSSGPVSVS